MIINFLIHQFLKQSNIITTLKYRPSATFIDTLKRDLGTDD